MRLFATRHAALAYRNKIQYKEAAAREWPGCLALPAVSFVTLEYDQRWLWEFSIFLMLPAHRPSAVARSFRCIRPQACSKPIIYSSVCSHNRPFRTSVYRRSALKHILDNARKKTFYSKLYQQHRPSRRFAAHAVTVQFTQGWPIWACLISASTSAQVSSLTQSCHEVLLYYLSFLAKQNTT